jgi:hypothetical protein
VHYVDKQLQDLVSTVGLWKHFNRVLASSTVVEQCFCCVKCCVKHLLVTNRVTRMVPLRDFQEARAYWHCSVPGSWKRVFPPYATLNPYCTVRYHYSISLTKDRIRGYAARSVQYVVFAISDADLQADL